MICIISSKVYFFLSDDLRAIVVSDALLTVLAEVPHSKACVLLMTKLSFSIAYSKVKLNDKAPLRNQILHKVLSVTLVSKIQKAFIVYLIVNIFIILVKITRKHIIF